MHFTEVFLMKILLIKVLLIDQTMWYRVTLGFRSHEIPQDSIFAFWCHSPCAGLICVGGGPHCLMALVKWTGDRCEGASHHSIFCTSYDPPLSESNSLVVHVLVTSCLCILLGNVPEEHLKLQLILDVTVQAISQILICLSNTYLLWGAFVSSWL